MKQIVITGGKGGCGKTSVAIALASIADNFVLADCDVDSPNIEIIADPDNTKTTDFTNEIPRIDPDKCIACGQCVKHCQFDAISSNFVIDEMACEMCGLCKQVCPVDAVEFHENVAGYIYESDSRFGKFFHAFLKPGEENSGMLVTKIRELSKEKAIEDEKEGVIVDGSPGVGCPVIASITGADYVVAVAESSISGLHDLKRIVELARILRVSIGVVINKADISGESTDGIQNYVLQNDIALLGKIPFDREIVDAHLQRKSIVEFNPDSEITGIFRDIWNRIGVESDKR